MSTMSNIREIREHLDKAHQKIVDCAPKKTQFDIETEDGLDAYETALFQHRYVLEQFRDAQRRIWDWAVEVEYVVARANGEE